MTFGAPLFFWAFAAFPLLIAIFFANEQRRHQLLTRLVAARLAARLAGNVSVAKRRVRFLLMMLGLAAAILALAQPRYGFDWEQTKRKGRDVLIAIDTSRSMLADDLKPNRLTRAKLAAQDLIAELKGDRVGVVAFAGTAFLQAPLTVDYSAVLTALNELDTEIIPEGGTNIAEMIRTAHDAFGKGESENRALIVFTDGEELDTNGIKAAEELKNEIRIFTVGIGSPEGALIPLPARGGKSDFVKDESGQIVKSRLDEDRLRKIAESTGGFYLRLQSGRPEMQKIVRDGLSAMSEQDIDARLSRHPIERYQWPLSAALILLGASTLVGERRRTTGLRAALVLALLPLGAYAVNPGVEEYQRRKYPEALNEFSTQLKRQPESPALQFDRGAAAYKAGDLDQALAAFSQAVTSPDPHLRTRAAYNLGNTLFQRGVAQKEKAPKIQEWKNALQHYEQALKVEPKNADAIYNRDVVRKLLEELEKEEQQDQQKKDDKKDEDKKDDQKKDQQKQQNKDEQKKDDQQKQDQKDNKDQQQQPKDGQDQKDQDKKDGSSQPKDSEQKQDQQPQDGKGDPQKPEDKKGDAKDQPQKGDEKKPQPQNGQDPKDGNDKKDGQAGEKPEPGQDQPQPQKQGEAKPAQPQPGDEKQDAQAEEAANAQAAAEGKMTEKQAEALLDSLKNEDQKVRLLDTRKQSKSNRPLRNW